MSIRLWVVAKHVASPWTFLVTGVFLISYPHPWRILRQTGRVFPEPSPLKLARREALQDQELVDSKEVLLSSSLCWAAGRLSDGSYGNVSLDGRTVLVSTQQHSTNQDCSVMFYLSVGCSIISECQWEHKTSHTPRPCKRWRKRSENPQALCILLYIYIYI